MIDFVLFAFCLLSPLMVVTWFGARTRGLRAGPAVLASLCFPVAWAAWYLLDEHPYGESHRKAV